MAKRPRPYSMKYTARGTPRRYLLSGIPPTLWANARARAKREDIAMRQVLLQLLEEWLARPRVESMSEPHTVGTDAPTPENDPVGRFRRTPRRPAGGA